MKLMDSPAISFISSLYGCMTLEENLSPKFLGSGHLQGWVFSSGQSLVLTKLLNCLPSSN
jgi:hypothetical protein